MVSWKTKIKSKIPIAGINESLYLSAYYTSSRMGYGNS